MQTGKKTIVRVANANPKFWRVVGNIGVVIGFLASMFGFYWLAEALVRNFFEPSAGSLMVLVPSISSTVSIGIGYFAVPFWYWIIVIAVVAVVHEGFHGIMSAVDKVKIKSLGFGLMAILPLAFVEVDENQLAKKKISTQLRVLAAGSYSNFIFSIIFVFILIFFASVTFTQSGISFDGYMPAQVSLGDIQTIDSRPVIDFMYIAGELQQNKTVTIVTENRTYLADVSMLKKQLDVQQTMLIVYEDYPAYREKMTGVIVRINDREIKNSQDLNDALEAAGPDSFVTVYMNDSGKKKVYLVKTGEAPEQPAFTPDTWQSISMDIENIFPGSISFGESVGKAWGTITDQEKVVSWRSLKNDRNFWQYIYNKYPRLRPEAQQRIDKIDLEMSRHSEPGYLGIANFATYYEIRPELSGFAEPLTFVQGLLAMLFLINFGVGLMNLMPLKPLDGGKMWEAVFMQVLPKKQAKKASKALTYITLAMLILTFVIQFRGV
jgi:membrane-associated protease RseP (regulator of RpoE activity)